MEPVLNTKTNVLSGDVRLLTHELNEPETEAICGKQALRYYADSAGRPRSTAEAPQRGRRLLSEGQPVRNGETSEF
jgi:hypothetical protein